MAFSSQKNEDVDVSTNICIQLEPTTQREKKIIKGIIFMNFAV